MATAAKATVKRKTYVEVEDKVVDLRLSPDEARDLYFVLKATTAHNNGPGRLAYDLKQCELATATAVSQSIGPLL